MLAEEACFREVCECEHFHFV